MMKNLKSLSLNISEKEYRRRGALSFSLISKFYKEGVSCLKTLYKNEEKSYFTFGKIVDKLLTEPEDFDNEFICISLPPLGPKKQECTNLLFELYSDKYKDMKEIPSDLFLKALDKVDYFRNWSADKRIESIKKDAIPFYNGMVKAKGKTLITAEDLADARRCVHVVLSSPHTKHLFEPTEFEDHHSQLKFESQELISGGVRCMFDRIIVNHVDKTILPIDIKTTGKYEYEFKKSYMDFCYWMQASIYTNILKEVISKDDYYKDFKIQPFIFVVVNRNSLTPIVFIDRQAGHLGDRVTKYGKVIPSWQSIADRLLWHINHAKVSCPKEIYEKGYVEELDLFEPMAEEAKVETLNNDDYEQIFQGE